MRLKTLDNRWVVALPVGGGDHDYKGIIWGMLVMMYWLYECQFPGCVTFFALVLLQVQDCSVAL